MTDDAAYDYSEYQERPTDALFNRLHRLVEDYDRAQREVNELEAQLKRAQERVRDLRERMLPEVMATTGQRVLTVRDRKLTLVDEVRASLPKDPEKRAAALSWVDGNGHGSIVKRRIVVAFDRDHEAWARKVERNLRRYKEPLDVAVDRDIHHSTLKSWIGQMLAEGVDVPLPLFQGFIQPIVKIS